MLLPAACGLAGFACPAVAHDEPAHVLERLEVDAAPGPARAERALARAEYSRLLGDLEAADRWAARALELGAERTAVRLLEAQVALDREEAALARAKLDEVLANHPGHAPALRLRARSWIRSGHPEAAVRDLRAYLAAAPRPAPEIWIECAELERACRHADPEAGLATLEQALEQLGRVPDLVLRLARWEAAAGRLETALARLDALPPSLHATGRVAWERVLLLEAAGRTWEAQAALTEALDALAALSPARRAAPATLELERAVRERLAASPGLRRPAGE